MADLGDTKDKEQNVASTSASPIPAVTDQEKELSKECIHDFESRQFLQCLVKLNNLASLRPTDFKVTLNKVVADFHQSCCTRTDELRKSLHKVCQQAQVYLEDVDNLEDIEHAILYYNHAVILYYLHQYKESARILEKLFQFIEPLDEVLVHKILFLLIEVYLCMYQPDKAVPGLAYLEKLVYGGNGKGDKASDNSKESSHRSPSPHQKYKLKLHMYKARIYLQLKSMKSCKREIKSVINYAGMNAPTCFIKSNFEYLRQNYRKAIKLLNSAPESPSCLKTGECRPAMYYNNQGCIHFYMRKYNLSAFYFRRALQENENTILELPKKNPANSLSGRPLCTLAMNRRYELLYNSGITFLHAGRPLAAFDCLIEALQIYHCNARLWLRIAECCVAANKGSSEEEMKGLPSAPRKGIVQDVIGTSNHRKIVLTSGSLDNKYNCDGQSAAMPVATLQFAAICLNNALSLLQEQEAAMPGAAVSNRRSSDSEHSQGNEATKANVPAGASAPPGAPLKQYEVESLKCSILANSAYVCLGLGDVLTALEHSINLLNQPKLSGSHKFLGHLYAAEALVSLDKISDAISHLSIDSITDVSVTYPGAPEVSGDKGGNDIGGSENSGDVSETPTAVTRYFPASIQSARATFLFNLSTSYSLRSEYDKARRALQQACSLIPASEIPQQALILAVYLELQNGNFPLALQMVKKNQLLPYAKMSDSRHGGQVTPTMGVIGRKSVRK